MLAGFDIEVLELVRFDLDCIFVIYLIFLCMKNRLHMGNNCVFKTTKML